MTIHITLRASSLIGAFSAIMIVGALVLPASTHGVIEASTTHSPPPLFDAETGALRWARQSAQHASSIYGSTKWLKQRSGNNT